MTYNAKLLPILKEMRWGPCKIVAGQAGRFAVLKDAALPFNVTYRSKLFLLARRWVLIEDGVAIVKKAFFAKAESNILPF
ncbi:MAG: hypothetical protein HGB35_01805 [Geobacteraceae bacterium]|nr:hypothetical protein [Geobacteraceae bacterium]